MLPISYYILPCNSFGNSRPYFKVFQNSKATSENVKKLTQTILFSAGEIKKKRVISFIDSPKYRIGISNWGTVLGGWTWITRLEDDNQTTAPQKDSVHGDLPTLIWLFNPCMVYLENFWQFLIGSNISCLARDSLSYLKRVSCQARNFASNPTCQASLRPLASELYIKSLPDSKVKDLKS